MTPGVFEEWRDIRSAKIANDGEWVSYINFHDKKDPVLELYQHSTNRTYIFDRADKATFTEDSKYLIFKVHPAKEIIKEAKRNKVNKDQLPKDSLCILKLSDQSQTRVPRVQDYSVPKYWSGQVFITQDPIEKKSGDSTSVGSTSLIIWDLENEKNDTVTYIDKFHLAEDSPGLVLTRLKQDTIAPPSIHYFDFENRNLELIKKGKGKFDQIAISPNAKKVAFLFDQDTSNTFHRPYHLYHWNTKGRSAVKMANNNPKFLNDNLRISEKGKLRFSKSGQRLFFGVASFAPEVDTTLLPEEIVQVEVWTSKDLRTYPHQKTQLKNDQNKTYSCVYDYRKKQFIQLQEGMFSSLVFQKNRDSDYALAYDESPGMRAMTWEGFPIRKNISCVNLLNGRTKTVVQDLAANVALSPEGKYIYYYNRNDESWYAFDVQKSSLAKIAGPEVTNFNNELHDLPIDEYSYRSAGWLTNDEALLVYDRYDIWKLDPSGISKPERITNGRASKKIHRAIILDREKRSFPSKVNWLIHIQNEENRSEGYALYNPVSKSINSLIEGPTKYTRRPVQAKNKNRIVFDFQNFQIYPDLYLADNFDFKGAKRISDINPQQSTYGWGSIESFSWKDYQGVQVKGMIVKPPNFDPNKKYPLIVNFYERSSDRIHNYPKVFPHRSTINYAYYANRGYVIFNPDVAYITGEPGESAYRAVMSGVDALLGLGFVDEKNMGLQGHSWGGYQIAYLLTRTDRFKCAESGAPVVNMTSAYGGIRWRSGLSRMFQYENTQSRLGATLWENPEVYLKNSPLFELDKMKTPVLIMHNDKDGAVPWYQGIEYFMALRRLNKMAWFLNYNNEPHWPVKRQNREDFQLRMSQFFDHFLMNNDAPRWMKEGVPAINKGIDQALELYDSN